MASREVVVGIDFGTSNSSLSISFPNKEVKTIRLDGEDNNLLRSIVKYSNSETIVGRDANDLEAVCSGNVVFNAKRLIGRKYWDLEDSVKNKSGAEVVEDDDGYAAYDIPIIHKKVSPINVVSDIIKKIYKEALSATEGYTISCVVVTYPASYRQDQIAATKTAVNSVIDVPVHLIKEPIAASYTYLKVNGYNDVNRKNVLVYDLGGGTFDLSLIRIENQQINVLKTAGNDNIGGEHFDDLIVDYVIKEYEKNKGDKLMPEKVDENLMSEKEKEEARILYERLLSYLRELCKKAKERLCMTEDEVPISIHSFMEKFREYNKSTINRDYDDSISVEDNEEDIVLTREQFERMIKNDIATTIQTVENTLKDQRLKAEDIDEVVLIGGSSRIPYVRRKLKNVFGDILCYTIDPTICVSYGAAAFGRERDLVEVNNIEGIKYDYYTLIYKKNGKIGRSIMIPKGSKFDRPVEKEYLIPASSEGCWTDSIYEGDINDTKGEKELASIEGSVTNWKDRRVIIKYIFTLYNDGLLHYKVVDEDSGKTIINEKAMSTRYQSKQH